MNYQKTNILQLKFGHKYKNLPRLLGGAMKISGCAGNFKVVLKSLKGSAAPFYNGTWRTLLKLYVFKATKNNHVSEKEMVLQQNPQNTRWARIFVNNNCL